MKVAKDVLELIGQTPVVKLNIVVSASSADVFVKLENYNPAGSVKDRAGLYMIEKAEQEGKLNQDSIILEATSGNTGIGLAMAACIKKYPIEIVMPENMSEERKRILSAYGAKLVMTSAAKGMRGAVEEAERMAAKDPKYFLIKQFENTDNPESHEMTTGPEILEQMNNKLDVFVSGVGSGGTITGVAKVLKAALPEIMIVGVEPANSAVLSGNSTGFHSIQGIGAGFIPPVLNQDMIDKIMPVRDEDAMQMCRDLANKEALLLGISSGAAIHAAVILAEELGPGKKVLVIAPDGAEKYMSMDLFD
ncbi:MAG TPA: cysteine synthase A [Syntrophomonadaceae bacterium]|nr:cysteine synthase A [Syntrophomonadaceae bacterium]